MARRNNIAVEILMAGDTGIRAYVEAFQIAHTGADTRGIRPVGAGVRA